MMSNLFKVYLAAGEKHFVSYIQHQNDKYDDRYNIYKDKVMTLDINKYKNRCTKEKWIYKSHEEKQIVGLSAEHKSQIVEILQRQSHTKVK